MNQAIYLLLFSILVLSPILGRNLQQGNQGGNNQNQQSSVNCNDNKDNPSCLMDDTQIFQQMKSNVPDYINNMQT